MPTVTFVNEKVTAEAESGEDLRSVAQRSGVQLYEGPHRIVNCMGHGLCGSCNVIIKSGNDNCTPLSLREKFGKLTNPVLGVKVMSHDGADIRLACQTKIQGDIEVQTKPPINWHGEKFWN